MTIKTGYTVAQMTDGELKRTLAEADIKIMAADGQTRQSLEELWREIIDEQDKRRKTRRFTEPG